MKLKKLNLKNFRGYQEIIFDFNDFTGIIGKNDVGKSTILEALDIFFNFDDKSRRVVIPDIYDLNINADSKEFIISCVFELSDIDKPIVIDSSSSTTLKEEYMLNRNNELEIVTKWDCDRASITKSARKIFIKANIPYINEENFLTMKIRELRRHLEEIKDDIGEERYNEVNKSRKSSIRKALYEFYKSDMEPKEQLIPIGDIETDVGDLWKSLLKILPSYFLFQSDRDNTSKDTEVQTPLKAALAKALAEYEEQLNEITENVINEVSKVGEQTIKKLDDFDSDIARGLKTTHDLKKWDTLFTLSIEDDKNIPLEKRGSGIRRLILLSYFRVEAEKSRGTDDSINIIYAIEEPETSQHPDYQRLIFETLDELTQNSENQVIITTHTPELAKLMNSESLIFINRNEENIPVNIIDEQAKKAGIIESLGILPTINSEFVLCVEGRNDVNFLTTITENIEELRSIFDLSNVSIIPMHGSNLQDWINMNYLRTSNINEFHLYDSDRQDYVELVDKINRENGDRKGLCTDLLEIENYIPINHVEQHYSIEIDKSLDEWKKLDVPQYLENKLQHVEDIHEDRKSQSVIKKELNSSVTKKIGKEDLINHGVYEEILSWFEQMDLWSKEI